MPVPATIRAGDDMAASEAAISDQGKIGWLFRLHNELDAAVAEAYGWPDDLFDEEILERLFKLSQERAREEAEGNIRWLRME